jgi:hypothetical protein
MRICMIMCIGEVALPRFPTIWSGLPNNRKERSPNEKTYTRKIQAKVVSELFVYEMLAFWNCFMEIGAFDVLEERYGFVLAVHMLSFNAPDGGLGAVLISILGASSTNLVVPRPKYHQMYCGKFY